MAVALFDLDCTLIDCNSGRLWVASEYRAGRMGLREVAWASQLLVRYGLGLEGGLEAAFAKAAATLEGTREEELDERVKTWFEAKVRHRLRPGGEAALAHHRAAGDRLVLATSGTWYAARAAADAFGLTDVVATTFEVVDGSFTGAVRGLAVGAHKAARVREWASDEGVDLADCVFYTDSATDLALLDEVGAPVVVNPDRKLKKLAAQRGWSVEDWGTR